MSIKLQPLPFGLTSLQPAMSRRTLELHHGRHHAGYVKKLNGLLRGSSLESATLEEIIQTTSGRDDMVEIFNNAAQVWNHDFFWRSMKPGGGGKPDGELMRAIKDGFASFGEFRKAFVSCATGRFGSGWVWLVIDQGRLRVVSTGNADNPLVCGQQALTCCDVWEHAYYVDFENDREAFVTAFLGKLVNWEFAAARFALQGEGNYAAARRYQEQQKEFAASPGRVERAARRAAEAIDGAEGAVLEEARISSARG